MSISYRFLLLPLLFACMLAALCLPSSARAATTDVRIKIVTTDGDIIVQLDGAHAPITVANFLQYVDKHFYDGGTFFRAIPGFVIQGGNHSLEKPTDTPIKLETPAKTGILNKDGAISMARTSDPNSATSEFFLCDGDQPVLDGSATSPGYAAFGHVIAGLNIVRKISHLPAQSELLLTPVKILKVRRVS